MLSLSVALLRLAQKVTVQFLKGDTLISKGIIRAFEDTASVENLVLIITENVTGEYACKVDTVYITLLLLLVAVNIFVVV